MRHSICFLSRDCAVAERSIASMRQSAISQRDQVAAMFSLSNLSVKAKLGVLCLTFIVGTGLFAAVCYTTLQSLRIGSARYSSLVELRELRADVAMPHTTTFP